MQTRCTVINFLVKKMKKKKVLKVGETHSGNFLAEKIRKTCLSMNVKEEQVQSLEIRLGVLGLA